MPSLRRGFTLVEISIVLVVIGLVVGGVLVGRSLIRNSELQSVTVDVQKYISATDTFKKKYQALPGDMADATSQWGKDNVACPADTGTVSVPGTCNGNGNDTLNLSTEFFRYWQHLALAGLIEGQFSGVAGGGGAQNTVVGTNVPASKISTAAGFFAVIGDGAWVGDANWFTAKYNHIYVLGATYANAYTLSPMLTTEEAFKIDTKMDDGKPGTGMVMTFKNGSAYSPNCASTAVENTAVYNTDTSAVPAARGFACTMIFKTGF